MLFKLRASNIFMLRFGLPAVPGFWPLSGLSAISCYVRWFYSVSELRAGGFWDLGESRLELLGGTTCSVVLVSSMLMGGD